jgi:hypothetical protein
VPRDDRGAMKPSACAVSRSAKPLPCVPALPRRPQRKPHPLSALESPVSAFGAKLRAAISEG